MEQLKKLCDAVGPSGFESEVRELIRSIVEPYADSVDVDKVGNLYVFKKGAEQANNLVLSAHMDEVGVMVTSIGEDGELLFETLGGIDVSVMTGRRVLVGKNRVPGIISAKAIHMQSADERRRFTPRDKMYIQLGTLSREETEKLVEVGDVGTFVPNFEPFGEGFVKSKALDDRMGCAALMQIIIDGDLKYDTWFAFVTREEIGCRGSAAAAYKLRPDIAITAEATTASDIFGVPEASAVCHCGSGPAVSFADTGTVYDISLYSTILDTAKSNGIPCQPKAAVAGGNDASSYQRSAEPCYAAAVSVPTRYIHSACSVASIEDYNNTVKLLRAIAQEETIRKMRG